MPHMNRIRVNNVKYNFGTQQYDDFVMRMHGKNTIYDLANGGGKSVLMLLLLQNLIPNCTLDEKQPIEKLFRTSGGSTTIHSLVEWNLDECDIKEGYRFMLTGFCARKAKDIADEEESGGRDTAAIEYFNYCIFYRAYNANDLVNLPLIQEGERITYSGLKNYLKELERNVPELKVYVFDRKGEYQQFISRFGLYESSWEIIRGINKTEGHVRTYFETNYRTTRKVVEDLLIEEIIEKSFRDKMEKENLNEDMAKTLLDMRDKLLELSEKKNEMGRFQHQKELLSVLHGRVEALRTMYQEKDVLSRELLSAHDMLSRKAQEEEAGLLKRSEDMKQHKQECLEKNHVIACLQVQQEESNLKEQEKQEKEALQQCEKWQKKMTQEMANRKQKECVNDYLEYQQVKLKRDEQAAVVSKAKEGSGDYLELLYDYAAMKKKILDEHLIKQEAQLESLLKEEKEIKVILKSGMHKKRDLECEQAVQQADSKRVQMDMQTLKAQMMEKKNQTGLLLLEEVFKVLQEKQEQKLVLQESYQKLAEKEKEQRDAATLLAMKKQELEWKQQDLVKQQEKENTLLSRLQDGKVQADALAKLYQVETAKNYEKQLAWTELAITKQFVYANQEMAKCKQEGMLLERKIKACDKGMLLADDTMLNQVQEYLKTRHGLQAMPVQEVLSVQTMQEREDVLHRLPFAPYGLLVRDATPQNLEVLAQDGVLRELAADCMVVLFTEDMLANGEFGQQPGMLLLHGDEHGMYEENGYEARKQTLLNERKLLLNEQEQLADNCDTMQQEMLYILQQESLLKFYLEQAEDKEKALQQVSQQSVKDGMSLLVNDNVETQEQKYAKEAEQFLEEERRQQKAGRKLLEEQEQVKEQLTNILEEIALLEEIAGQQKSYEELAEQKKQIVRNQAETDQEITFVTEELEQKNQHFRVIKEQIAAITSQMEEEKEQWTLLYATYDQGRSAKPCEFTEDELDTEFASMKLIVEQGIGSVSDKQALVDTLQENMQKILDRIKDCGVDVIELESQYQANELYVASKEEMQRLSEEIAQCEQQHAEAKQHLHQIQKNKSRCEGRVEHGMKQLAEQGIHYQPLDIPKEDIIRALDEQKQVYAKMQEKQEQLSKEYSQKAKEHAKLQDFVKDVKRSIEWYHLKVDETMEYADVSEYTIQQLKDCQKRFEKAMEQEKKARQELEEYKQRTAQTLTELKAFELAEVIRKDIVMPENLGQMQELADSLKDMIGYIGLEEERVEQGIADMQLIKSNFENQCIRRCQDVKTELERLPKLSGIMLDGEKIQVISLHIPYIPQEQAAAKMAEYIDRIVRGVDQYETTTDRMRYIRQQLALKRLFSVIVTDMNAIRLNLYKRERIREQSRYLRYEEAVGSTGQSQGIYIQFLIGIINYIANIHSVSSDNNELGKVIFIDNPFGAAKDVYIWEPIFEMLKTNNVQLIVPARGATPAITSRFDVNYVLGQKMSGKTQQTVVVDYRSQVEKTEMEYKMVEFSQNSFEFI